MKKILCFGDSNTLGFIPGSGQRYDNNTRWTGILQSLAQGEFEITEAGCNNRTCFSDSSDGMMFTGYKILPEFLKEKFDCVILALGINDLQIFYKPSMSEVRNGIEKLIDIVRSKSRETKIIIASPSALSEDVLKGEFSFQFDETSIIKSNQIGQIYETAAKNNGCRFIDLNKIANVSPLDGLHYEPEQHRLIAHAMFEVLCDSFKNFSNETVSD